MLVPGCSRLRNHGARAGSAFGGGSASAVAANNTTTAKKGILIPRANVVPQQRTQFRDLRSWRCDASISQLTAVPWGCPKEDAETRAEDVAGQTACNIRAICAIAAVLFTSSYFDSPAY